MCLGDWRLGRLVRASYHEGQTDINNRLTIPSNRQRVGLTILPDGSGNATLLVGLDGAIDTFNPALATPEMPFHCTLATHGDLPSRAITVANAGGANNPISWIEYYMTEKALSGADGYLKREGFF